MKTKKLLIRIAAILVLIAIGAVMMVIGRGHTLYFDNTTAEYNGISYEAPYKIEVNVKGEQVAKLYERERGSSTWIGQNFNMELLVTPEKGGTESAYKVSLSLPYGVDGIIVNLPAVLNGLPQDAWFEEFIPAPVEEEDVEEVNTDEFTTDDFGGMEDPEAAIE